MELWTDQEQLSLNGGTASPTTSILRQEQLQAH